MKSPCHNVEMYGGEEMVCCPTCGKWYKAEEVSGRTEAEMLKAMGLDPSMFSNHK